MRDRVSGCAGLVLLTYGLVGCTGEAPPPPSASLSLSVTKDQSLRDLARAFKAGAMSQADYDQQRQQILSSP